jgi:hypothetical protein
MLPLNSDKWSELQDAYGPATNIPELLQQLSLDPRPKRNYTEEPWFSLWSALCHQGDIFTASYAAVPHIIQIGYHAEGKMDHNFFDPRKEIVVTKLKGKGPEIPDYLFSGSFGFLQHLQRIKQVVQRTTSFRR